MSTNETHGQDNSFEIGQTKYTKFNGLNQFSDVIGEKIKNASNLCANEFPVEVFPKLFKELIIDLNKSLNFPLDYTGTAILTAISITVGTTAKVKVKNGWCEFPSIYACLIGNAGSNKTHPINIIFSPIKSIDTLNHKSYESSLKMHKDYLNLPKDEKNSVPKIDEPKLKKSILTNYTPEVLHKRLSENLRGCIIVCDEMTTFLEGMNNYSKGDQLGIYLSFWNNQPTTIDRIGNSVPMLISNPFLSIIGSIQSRILSNAFPIQKLNSGFFQRFLFAFPQTNIKHPINENEINNTLIVKYNDFIVSYYNENSVKETDAGLNSRVLTFAPEAKDLFLHWNKENCELVNENLNTITGEIASKMDMHFIRLALLLQIMENPKSTEIQIKAVKGAKMLCHYFLNCSLQVLNAIKNPTGYLESLTQNKKLLYMRLNDEFTTAQAVELGLRNDFKERRVKEFLNDTNLFLKIKHGYYKKL